MQVPDQARDPAIRMLLPRYVRPVLPALACLYLPLGALLVYMKWAKPIQPSELVAPVSLAASNSLYHGALTWLGLFGWMLSVFAGVMCLVFARDRIDLERGARAIFVAGAISLLLLADDAFQLHRPVIPDALGIPAIVVLSVYAGLLLAWALTFREEIGKTDALILLVAMSFFAIWIISKASPAFRAQTLLEAGSKVCGIVGWTLYVCRSTWQLRRRRLSTEER